MGLSALYFPSILSTYVPTMATSPDSLSPVIVTGGCGFTGSHMVHGLLQHEENPQIHVIARTVRDEIPGVTYHKCDISSLDEVQVSHLNLCSILAR